LELKVRKRTSNELELEIVGEGHTFCNLLESVLLEDKAVEFAGYNIEHPLISNATIYVRTKGAKKPEEALEEAIEKVIQREKELAEEFNNALQKWQGKSKKKTTSK
jgi:DNA-directed RNA polymerase subunit L